MFSTARAQRLLTQTPKNTRLESGDPDIDQTFEIEDRIRIKKASNFNKTNVALSFALITALITTVGLATQATYFRNKQHEYEAEGDAMHTIDNNIWNTQIIMTLSNGINVTCEEVLKPLDEYMLDTHICMDGRNETLSNEAMQIPNAELQALMLACINLAANFCGTGGYIAAGEYENKFAGDIVVLLMLGGLELYLFYKLVTNCLSNNKVTPRMSEHENQLETGRVSRIGNFKAPFETKATPDPVLLSRPTPQ